MIDWEKLYKKFGRLEAAKKFEDMALDYVSGTYKEYSWVSTPRTKDGNKDFHTIENELLNIWGEAKYKKDSVALTRKDLDPTILSGLINGTVELIIFVTNGRIPDKLIDRMLLGAKIKNIKLSFVLEHQLADWLILNPEKYLFYFEEELNVSIESYKFVQSIEIRKVSFFELVSIDFSPNISKVEMLVGDTFVLNYIILALHKGTGNVFFEKDFPFSIVENKDYDNPNNFQLVPGINIISFMVKAKEEYNNNLRVGLEIDAKQYNFVTEKIIIKSNRNLKIVYFKQIDIINRVKGIIDKFSFDIGNYMFFIHGKSGMGKSHILLLLSQEYAIKNDITYVLFEKSEQSNTNYLLLCRILIFLQYGNVFWDFGKSYLKKICLSANTQDVFNNIQLCSIIDGCFDANIAKTTIISLIDIAKRKTVISSKKNKQFRILLLDDIQYLNLEQSKFLKIIIKQQLNSKNNNIIVFSGTQDKFYDKGLEKLLLDNLSNYFFLDSLKFEDKKYTIQKNFILKDNNISSDFINKLPGNLLLFNELLFNLKCIIPEKTELNSNDLLNFYLEIFDDNLIFQSKFRNIKAQFYLFDIICLFKKGISVKHLYNYPSFDKDTISKDIKILINQNCVRFSEKNIVMSYHDYITENYRKLRKGKELSVKTGGFIKFLLENKLDKNDTNYLLYLLCKCGKRYFNYYNKKIQELMLTYINTSQYGTAIYFAQLFYESISDKKNLNSKEKYYLYLYADCLVHCDNQYRAASLLKKRIEAASDYSFEKYEAAVSLLNQRFWSIDLKGLIEDSKIFQLDLETMFMYHIEEENKNRFKKAYESCFNRRMVTFLLTDKYELAQNAYQDGLKAIKKLCELYRLEYMPEIATIVMDYARGIENNKIKMANRLFDLSAKIFKNNISTYFRRNLICNADLLVSRHILGERINYKDLDAIAEKLNNNRFTFEYIKTIMKTCACRLIDYSNVIKSLNDLDDNDLSFHNDILSTLQNCLLDKQIVLQNREKFLYNYLTAYIYICKEQYSFAEKNILENIEYVKQAGKSYHIPLLHNLKNIKSIKYIHWFQQGKDYDETVFILESRYW